MPINSSGGTTGEAVTITPAQLAGAAGYVSKYFYLGSDGGMVFYSPANGATTTPGVGSDHTRSELRELYKTSGPTEWTNLIGGTMNARCQIEQSPSTTDLVTIGQIHGLSSILLILGYNPTRNQIIARVYDSPNSTDSQVYVLASNVPLKTMIDYSIQWIGAVLSVTINSKTTNWTTDLSWTSVPVYFKAGAYSAAPNSGNPATDATQVEFYSLSIQH